MKDMTLKTKTVIWTAGIKVNSFYKNISGIVISKNSRVAVDEYLGAKGLQDIFILGDSADKIQGKTLKIYNPKKVSYVVPIGPNWAAAKIGPVIFYGFFAYHLRELIDFMFFLSILPFSKALNAFKSGNKMCESCEICLKAGE